MAQIYPSHPSSGVKAKQMGGTMHMHTHVQTQTHTCSGMHTQSKMMHANRPIHTDRGTGINVEGCPRIQRRACAFGTGYQCQSQLLASN